MNSKQEILNAFREMRILNGYASIWKHHPMGVARDIDEWLLTTLTEFEREIREDERKIIVDTIGQKVHMVGNEKEQLSQFHYFERIKSQLEKEKHPSK